MRHRITTTSLPCVLAALGVLLGTSGCAPLAHEARTVLDPRTGASLTVADQPLVLARERRDLAVQARDYLTLLAAEVNVSGHRQLLLVAHAWSTIDSRARGTAARTASPLLIVADGRDLLLQPVPVAPLDSGALRRELAVPDDAEVLTAYYAIEPEALRYLCAAKRVATTFPQVPPALPFVLWRDGRAAQLRLLDAIGQ